MVFIDKWSLFGGHFDLFYQGLLKRGLYFTLLKGWSLFGDVTLTVVVLAGMYAGHLFDHFWGQIWVPPLLK